MRHRAAPRQPPPRFGYQGTRASSGGFDYWNRRDHSDARVARIVRIVWKSCIGVLGAAVTRSRGSVFRRALSLVNIKIYGGRAGRQKDTGPDC